jgi:hypothetical protein
MPDTGQITLFALDCGATNWRLYRVEYRTTGESAQIIGEPQPSPLTSFIDRRLPAVITLNCAGNGIESFGDVSQQQLDDEHLRERIREHFKPCIGSHLESNPLPHQKRFTHTQAMQYTQLLLQAVLDQIKQEKLRSAAFDDRVVFTFAYPVHWRHEHEGQVFNEFKSMVGGCFPKDYNGLRFVAEPEGAVLCLNSRNLIRQESGDKATLIIDVGGSTTDIIAGNVDPRSGRLNFLGRYGASFGGDLYDAELAKFIADELKIPPSALADDPTAMISLRVSAQRLKESLSRQLLHTNHVDHNPQRMVTLVMRDGSVYRRVITLDEARFHEITAGLENQFSAIIDDALRTVAVGETGISQVVLVGGGAQLYSIIGCLRQRFGKDKVLLADTPDEIVAQGIGLEWGASSRKIEPTIQFPIEVEEKHAGSESEQAISTWKLIAADNQPVHLPNGTTTVGRAKERGLLIDDPKVSRLHAELRASRDTLELVDMGSTNGTFVNSERLIPNQPRLLKPGDELLFGSTRFICQ